MKNIIIIISILLINSCLSAQNENSKINKTPQDNTPFYAKNIEIPYIEHTNLSADFDVIDTKGLEINLFSNIYGDTVSKKDFNPQFKIAWTKEYLLIKYKLIDDINYISPIKWRLWHGDALVLFLKKKIDNSFNFIQEIFVSDPNAPSKLLTYKYDYRKKNTYISQSNIISTAYSEDSVVIMQIAVPFQNFDTKAKEGDEYGLQLIAYDYDKKRDPKHIAYPLSYIMGVAINPWATKTIKLVKKTNQTHDLITRAFWLDKDSIRFVFYGNEKKYLGKKITLRDKKLIYFEDTIRKNDSCLFAFTIPMPLIDTNFKTTALFINDEFFDVVHLDILPIKYIKTSPIRFENSIRVFEKQDREKAIPDSVILFLGSSSIRKWESLNTDFENLHIINRAFGGSVAHDVNVFLDRIVLPYKPQKIVYYEGDNDIYYKMTPQAFIDTCSIFINAVKEKLPKTQIILLSIKPSPSRKRMWKEMLKANKMLKELADTTENVIYVDISKGMFDENGKIKKDIWERDRLHMNEKGYEIWREILKNYLYN